MTEQELPPQGISRRAVTKTAVWSIPVIAMAATIPAAAASVPLTYSISPAGSTGPNPTSGGGTEYVIYVQNTGTGPIGAGQLRITIPRSSIGDTQYRLSSINGPGWAELNPYPAGYDLSYRTFIWQPPLPPRFNPNGSENDPNTGPLQLLFRKVPPDRPETPTFSATFTAPPAPPVVYPMSVPY